MKQLNEHYHLHLVWYTDASHKGLRVVLYQKQDGRIRAISFASEGLKHSEKNTLHVN